MKISELIAELERIKREAGDLEAVIQTLKCPWRVEPVVRKSMHGSVVLLNP